MDIGAWWATVHEVTKESDMTQQLNYINNNGGDGDLVSKACLTLVILWTVAHQNPLSVEFSREEY